MSMTDQQKQPTSQLISARAAFLLVSFTLGQLGDGLNIFQGERAIVS